MTVQVEVGSEAGPRAKECEQPLEARKGKESASLWSLQEEGSPDDPFQTLTSREVVCDNLL